MKAKNFIPCLNLKHTLFCFPSATRLFISAQAIDIAEAAKAEDAKDEKASAGSVKAKMSAAVANGGTDEAAIDLASSPVKK